MLFLVLKKYSCCISFSALGIIVKTLKKLFKKCQIKKIVFSFVSKQSAEINELLYQELQDPLSES